MCSVSFPPVAQDHQAVQSVCVFLLSNCLLGDRIAGSLDAIELQDAERRHELSWLLITLHEPTCPHSHNQQPFHSDATQQCAAIGSWAIRTRQQQASALVYQRPTERTKRCCCCWRPKWRSRPWLVCVHSLTDRCSDSIYVQRPVSGPPPRIRFTSWVMGHCTTSRRNRSIHFRKTTSNSPSSRAPGPSPVKAFVLPPLPSFENNRAAQ